MAGLVVAAAMLLTLSAAGPDGRGSTAGTSPDDGPVAVTILPSPSTSIAAAATTEPPPTSTTTTVTTTPPTTSTRPPEVGSDSCRLAGRHRPQGTTTVVRGETVGGQGTIWDVRIEVEDGLTIDRRCFAEAVMQILNDGRGWGRTGELSFRRTDGDVWDLRLILASPGMVDRLCAPINTGGEFSCRNGDVVAINLDRWLFGAGPFGGDLVTYRRYVINHEVGHRLGHVHVSCPAAGTPAPVMMQQSKSTGECDPNGWPLDSEL